MYSAIIDRVAVYDIRFPTSESGIGSDALNKGDYSATYVEVHLEGGTCGAGLTFTNGRGNEIVCAAVRALTTHLAGMNIDQIVDDMRGFWRSLVNDPQLRWIGPEKGAIHMAVGAVINAIWDLEAKRNKMPLWQLLAEMDSAKLISMIDFRYIDDVLSPPEALEILVSGKRGWEERAEAARSQGIPAYTTSVGWLDYPDKKLEALVKGAMEEGWKAMKMKVGGEIEDDMRRAKIIRNALGENGLLMMDANHKWKVSEAIERMEVLGEYNPYWIEEPTHPDDIIGQAVVNKKVLSMSKGKCCVAAGEVVPNRVIFKQLFQSSAIGVCQVDACRIGGINEVLAVMLMATKYAIPVCPHAGGVGLSEYVQHLAMFDFVALSGTFEKRMVEYIDTLHEHFVSPARVKNARYIVPTDPGYSVEMRKESILEYSFPNGAVWQ